MHRFLVLVISLLALTLAACRPAPSPPPAETTTSSTAAVASGSGGGAAPVDAGAPAATSSTSTGALPDGCVIPSPRHTACESAGDCYDGSPCTDEACDLDTPPSPPDPFGRRGTCRWVTRPDGSGCDVSPGRDVCLAGACCPETAFPAGAAAPWTR